MSDSAWILETLLPGGVDGEDIPQAHVLRRVDLIEVGVGKDSEAQVSIAAQEVRVAEVADTFGSCW